MGKRKSNKKKKSGKEKSNSRKTLWTASAFIAIISMVLGGVYIYTKPPGRATASNPAPAKGQLIENRPMLSSALFSGKTALAYKYAAEIPKVIDSQFCYCYCKKNHNHKSLLTCFTSMHGSRCDICMDEVIYAYQLYQEGKSLDEIVVAVDKNSTVPINDVCNHFMEQTLQNKPAHIFIPYAVLFTALFAFFIKAVNKEELKPFQTEYPQESFIAPSFELPSLTGGKIKLKDYRGKVVFINFWATWCATCKVEMPSMQKVYDQFKDKGLEMLTISVDKDQSLIQPFMNEYKLTFPVLLDPESDVAKKDYKTTGVPETFIVNKHGIIVHKAIGPRDWATDDAIAAFAQLVEQS